MCLFKVFTEKEKDEYLKQYDSTWIPVKKVIYKQYKEGKFKYTGTIRDYTYKEGLNRISLWTFLNPFIESSMGIRYKKGFHFYQMAEILSINQRIHRHEVEVLTCYVKKSWITAIGKQGNPTVIVAKKAVFPQCPNKDLTKEEKKKYGINLQEKNLKTA